MSCLSVSEGLCSYFGIVLVKCVYLSTCVILESISDISKMDTNWLLFVKLCMNTMPLVISHCCTF